MSITPQLDRYLSVRRSLGYDLRTDERVLRRFARFADRDGAPYIDTALFLRWDASLPEAGTSTRSARLGKVRLFAQWLSSIDPAHEVPPRGLLPDRSGRPRPHTPGPNTPPPSPASESGQPAWAKAMKDRQTIGHGATIAAHTLKAGDSHGGGASINVSEKD